MHRFYCKPEDIKDNKICLSSEEYKHLACVLRLKEGDGLIVIDGKGKEYAGLIEEMSKGKAIIRISNVKSIKAPSFNITLAQAMPKARKLDYIIQKCTELGIDRIIPMQTERTIIKLSLERGETNIRRWNRIAIEAAKQSCRASVPEIENVLNFKDVLSKIDSYDLMILPTLLGKHKSIKEVLAQFGHKPLKDILVLIGPEGDFSPKEIELAMQRGAILASLGQRVLKVDTAAIFTVGVLIYELGTQ